LGGGLEGTPGTRSTGELTKTRHSVHSHLVLSLIYGYASQLGLRRGNQLGMSVRIVLADDHEVVRQGVRRFLETQPSLEICAEAANGQEAVEKTLSFKPDVVILDLSMPIMNGVEATRQIRQLLPSVKIIVFSMHDFTQLADTVKQAGADAYVSKSAQVSRLYEAIRSVLNNNQPA
jgi:DNA-binding NarL/FixJ family response regulator